MSEKQLEDLLKEFYILPDNTQPQPNNSSKNIAASIDQTLNQNKELENQKSKILQEEIKPRDDIAAEQSKSAVKSEIQHEYQPKSTKDKQQISKTNIALQIIKTFISLGIIAYSTHYICTSSMEYLRIREKKLEYSQKIKDMDKLIANNQFLEADKLSESLKQKLKRETNKAFELLLEEVQIKDNYIINPEIVKSKFKEVRNIIEDGDVKKAKELSSIILNEFKNEPSSKVKLILVQINNYIEYYQKITKINDLIKNNQFPEADALYKEIESNLNKEKNQAFEQFKNKLDYAISPKIIQFYFEEIIKDSQKGDFKKAKELNILVSEEFKNNHSDDTKSTLSKIEDYTKKIIDTSLKMLAEADLLFLNYQRRHSEITKNLEIKNKEELKTMIKSLESLIITYSSLKQNPQSIKELSSNIESSIKNCEKMEQKLLETDNLLIEHKKKYASLPPVDIESEKFEGLFNSLKEILQNYQELKMNDRISQVTPLIIDLNNKIKNCNINRKKVEEYSNQFNAIQQLIQDKKYNEADSKIKILAKNIEKEEFPSVSSLLNKIKSFIYKKVKFVPQELEQQIVAGCFVESIWQPPIYEYKRKSFFSKPEKKLVEEGKYVRGQWVPSIKEDFLIPAHYNEIQVHPLSDKEEMIKVISINKNEVNYSPTEKALINKWSEDIIFDYNSDNTYDKEIAKKEIPAGISSSTTQLVIYQRISGGLRICVEDKKTTLSQFTVFINKYLPTGKNQKLISQYDKQFLILYSSDSKIKDNIVSQELRLKDGILKLILQVESWGNNDESKLSNDNQYTSVRMKGKLRLNYQPNISKE